MNQDQPSPVMKPAQNLYFVNAPVDYGAIGGASILVYIIFLILDKNNYLANSSVTTQLGLAGFYLSFVCNWPHFSATNYRLYQSRDNIRQYPMTALVIPWVILAGMAGSFASPTVIAPYFVKLFWLWSPYHFSGQSVGISLIYARRAGFIVSKLERLALSGFIYSTFIAQNVRNEVNSANGSYYGISYPNMGLPQWTVTVATVWMYTAMAALVVLVVVWCVRNRRLLPPIVLLPAVAQYIWFVQSSGFGAFSTFIPFFHCLQYLLIAWSMQLKEKMDRNQIEPSSHYVYAETARWGLLNIIGGICLFLPEMLSHFGFSISFATGVILTGVQLHHFFVDGVIWKLKRKTVSSPLMVNISELLSRTPASVRTPQAAGQKA